MSIGSKYGLSFTRELASGTDFWSPDRSGDNSVANARGRGYAQELLDAMRADRNPVLLGGIVRAIGQGQVYGPVEIGFCHRLGVELLAPVVAVAAAELRAA
jgi:hypothetical protein